MNKTVQKTTAKKSETGFSMIYTVHHAKSGKPMGARTCHMAAESEQIARAVFALRWSPLARILSISPAKADQRLWSPTEADFKEARLIAAGEKPAPTPGSIPSIASITAKTAKVAKPKKDGKPTGRKVDPATLGASPIGRSKPVDEKGERGLAVAKQALRNSALRRAGKPVPSDQPTA